MVTLARAVLVLAVMSLNCISAHADDTCCKVCSNSQPCGNTCISKKKKCHTPPGCACSPDEESRLLPLIIPAAETMPLLSQQSVTVLDGDTFDLNGERVRLEGIDAPELEQICHRESGEPYACGVRSAAALKRILKGGIVTCQKEGEDRYGRTLAHCKAGESDVNREMVRRGWAFAFLKYSTQYVDVETEARASKVGVWRGQVDPPWEWRQTHK